MAAGLSRECTLLSRIERAVSVPRGSQLRLGIGDDCAIFRRAAEPRICSSQPTCFSKTSIFAGPHIRREMRATKLWRGIERHRGDGGTPRFCLLSLAVPRWADQLWVDDFYRGFLRLANQTGAPLAGGDLALTDRLACDVTSAGRPPGRIAAPLRCPPG